MRMWAQWAVRRVRRAPFRGIGVARVTSVWGVVVRIWGALLEQIIQCKTACLSPQGTTRKGW